MATRGTVEVGPPQGERPNGADKRLLTPLDVLCRASARTRQHRPGVIRRIGIEAALKRPGGSSQRDAPGLDIDVGERTLVTYKLRDFGRNLRGDRRLEPPFLATSGWSAIASSSASAQTSQASHKAATSLRNACAASIWRRTTAASSGLMYRDVVRPSTTRVTVRYGPCRAVRSVAHGHPGLPHFIQRSETEPRRMGWAWLRAASRTRTRGGMGGIDVVADTGPPSSYGYPIRKIRTPQPNSSPAPHPRVGHPELTR